jgi:hypothetical protein
MKRILLTILILLCSTPAFADWYWLKSGDYYVRSNGTDNDGWYYRRECSYGCSYHCARCNYVKVKPITPDVYSPNFEEQAMKLLERREVRNQRVELLGKMFGQSSSYTTSGYGQSAYSATEFVRQGVYGGGNTIMAVGEHYGAQNVDYLTPLQEQQRLMEGMQGLLGQGLAGTNYAATQSVEIAKINAYRDLGVASIRAAQQPTETYRTWNQSPGQPAQGSFHSSSTVSNSTDELVAGIGLSLQTKDCASCHRPNSAKGAPEFFFDEQEKAEVRRRLDLPTDDPEHMPGGKGGKVYSELEKTALLFSWDRKPSMPQAQPQRQYRPRVQAQVEQPEPPSNEPPPVPNPPVQE